MLFVANVEFHSFARFSRRGYEHEENSAQERPRGELRKPRICALVSVLG